MGDKFKKLILRITGKFLKLVLLFPPNGPHKTTLGIFEILSYRCLTIFLLENSKFPIAAYGEIKKPLLIWKTSDHRAKRSKMWDSWDVVHHITACNRV